MNRLYFTFAALLGAMTPLVMDSALKGVALLAAAALFSCVLFKASAAARHLIWLIAVVALIIVPVLSVALPEWQVLPAWTAPTTPAPLSPKPKPTAAAADTNIRTNTVSVAPSLPEKSSPPLAIEETRAPLPAPIPESASIAEQLQPTAKPIEWVPLVWGLGFSLFFLRLLAAHLLLRNSARRCSQLDESDPIAVQFEAAQYELGMRQRVTLLLDSKRTIPVAWGVLRPRLLLPAEAKNWDSEQLRSVLLHELAHLKRRDPLVLWITQIACALHWWNPLVWVAAWRLHVERERACDDLVLNTGVRPSAYAEHLLEVATKLSPAAWTSACGLAMARKSSLEGRLEAVLSEKPNRRRVTTKLALFTLLLGAAIAIPVAMLRAADPEDAVIVNEKSKALFEEWKSAVRSDGKIPGGRIGEIGKTLQTYINLNPGSVVADQCEPLLEKCDASHDWEPADAASLLDEIAAVVGGQAAWVMEENRENMVHPGKQLPKELENAPWGKAAPNGLRTAWLLEPRDNKQALGSIMKSRVLFNNSGTQPVVFATQNWIQSGSHSAVDADGKTIKISASQRLGRRICMIFRLEPGEYAEVEGHGIGVGEQIDENIGRASARIEAKAGDSVTFTPGKVSASFQTWTGLGGRKDSETVWNELIAARVDKEGPLPTSQADLDLLIDRVLKDFGLVETPFLRTSSLAAMTVSLQTAAKKMHFEGELAGGETKFTVESADASNESPDQVRSAWKPGRYPLSESAHLLITEQNQAQITILSKDPTEPSQLAYEIDRQVADGRFAFAWEYDSGKLWLRQNDGLREFDFTDPATFRAMKYAPLLQGAEADELRARFPEALKTTLFTSYLFAGRADRPTRPRPVRPDLSAPAAAAQESAEQLKLGAALTPSALAGIWKGENTDAGVSVKVSFSGPEKSKLQIIIRTPYRQKYWKLMNRPFPFFVDMEQDGDAIKLSPTPNAESDFENPISGRITVEEGGQVVLTITGYTLADVHGGLLFGQEHWVPKPIFTGKDVRIVLNPRVAMNRSALEGSWIGEKDGTKISAKIYWWEEKPKIDWQVTHQGKALKANMDVQIQESHDRAVFLADPDHLQPAPASVTADLDGSLHLTIHPRTVNWREHVPMYPAITDLVLKRTPAQLEPESPVKSSPNSPRR